MDIKQLKAEVKKLITACDKAGMHLEFVALIHFFTNSYILQVGAEWIDKYPEGRFTAQNLVVDKMYEVMSKEAIDCLNHIRIYRPNDDVKATLGDYILVNEIDYELDYSRFAVH
jgi:hypothetical protein